MNALRRNEQGAPPDSGVRLASRQSVDERIRTLVEDHTQLVARTVAQLGIPSGAVDDCVQKTFIIAAAKVDLIEEGREVAFLFSTARRVAANARRTLVLERAQDREPESLARLPDLGPDPEQAFESREAAALLEQLIEALPLELRDVFVLSELEGLTQATIAEVLEIPYGTVASRLRRARAEIELRARLG